MEQKILSRDINDFHSYLRWNSIQKHIDTDVSTLDIDCNVGTMTLEIAKTTSKPVVGIDVNPSVITKARKRAEEQQVPNCTFLAASAMAIPFDNGSFGQIVVADALEHTEDDSAIIRECFRLLKPNGKLIVNVPRPNYSALFNKAWIKRIGHLRDGYELRDIKKLTAGLFDVQGFDFNSRAKKELDNFYNKGLQILTDEIIRSAISGEEDLSEDPFGITISLIKKAKAQAKNRSLRVLHVGWGHPPNLSAGPIYYLHNLCMQQQLDNMEVACFVAGESSNTENRAPFLSASTFDGVQYFMVQNRPAHYFDWSNPDRETENHEIDVLFDKMLHDWRPDVVHFHNLIGLSMSLPIMAKKFGAATILSAHNYWMICTRDDLFAPNEEVCGGPKDGSRCASCVGNADRVTDFIYRTSKSKEVLANFCDRILAVSERVGQLFKDFGVPDNKVLTQHIGSVAAEEIWNRVGQHRSKHQSIKTPIKFAYFGTLSVRKGSHLILEAARYLKEYDGQFVIEIYGGGEPQSYRKRLDSLLNEDPFLQKVIKFKGGYWQQQMPELLAAIDLAIIPPLWEDNGPQTVMEVLSGGVPIIGARIGGVPDFVIDNVNGLLFKAGDESDLASAMKRVLDDPHLITKFRKNILVPVTMDEHREQLRKEYERLLTQKEATEKGTHKKIEEIYSDSQRMIQANDFDGAMQRLEELLSLSPIHVDAHNDLAVIYDLKGDVKKAKQHIELAVYLNETDLVAKKNLAIILFRTGETDRSLDIYKELMTTGILDIETFLDAARQCRNLNRLEDSRAFYRHVQKLDPNNSAAAAGIAELDTASKSVRTSTDELYRMSRDFMSAGKNEEAAKALEHVLSIDPKNAKALNDLALLYSIGGKVDTSIALFNRLLQMEPANVVAGKNLGSAYLRAHRIEDALSSYYCVLRISPKDPETLLAIGDICMALGKTEEAVVFYRDVLDSDPQNSAAAKKLAAIQQGHSTSKNKTSSDQTGSKSATKVLYDSAQAFIGEKKYEEARGALRSALEIEPDNPSYLNDLAVTDILTNRLSEAVVLLKKVLDADPQNKAARENIAAVQNALSSAKKNQFERIVCPYCGTDDAVPFRKSADIVKCNKCDTVYLRTRMTEQGMRDVYQTYADESSQVSLPKSAEEVEKSNLRRDYLMEEITSLVTKRGIFLDVGCAWGAFLDNARSRGFKTRGIEITRKTAEYAAKSLGLDVTSEQFVDTPFDRESVSVISMVHVLEHLPAPKAALAKAFDILEPGGLFAGIVPNIESLSSTVLKDRWEWLDPLHHYVHYSPSSLRQHLEQAGFIVERMYTTSGDCNRESLKNVIDSAYSPQTEREFGDVLKAVEKGGYGEEIRFFARKPGNGQSAPQPALLSSELLQDNLYVRRFDSLDDYRNFVSSGDPVLQSAKESGKTRLKNGESYHVNGYCWVCKKPSRFLVDTMYTSLADEQGVSPNWRERLTCVQCGNNSRMRAFIQFVEATMGVSRESKIYLTEQVTSVFKYFSRNYRGAIGSEFLASDVPLSQKDKRGIRNENLTQLTFADKEFDFVFSLEVLEHVPDVESALREVLRVLKPGGKFVFTVPFLNDSEKTVVRARVEDGAVKHILPPEYHGDPIRDQGSLCYRHFGWDIIDDLKRLGYGDAAIFLVHSHNYGYVGFPHVILVAQKEGKLAFPENIGMIDQPEENYMMPNEKKHLGGLPNVAAASINELYEKSQTFISAGKNDEAINVLQEILSLDPVNQKALNDLAVLYSLKGRLSESIALLNRLLQIEPANAIAGKNLGSLYLRANKVENALNSYYQVLQSSPNDTDALLAIADICLALGKTKEAVTFYQKVLNTDPQNVQATSRLVVIQQDFLDKLNNSGIPADIADTKTTGPTVSLSKEEEHRIRIGSPLPGAADGIADWGEFTVKELYDKAQLLIGEGKYEEAKETLKRALEIEPNDSSCLNDLAVLCSISKQNNTAIELLRRLLELEPINSVGRKNLGNLYLQENNLEEGLRTYSEVLKTVPNDVESLLTIARICLALNKPEDANLFFGKVLTTTQDPELLRQTLLELEKIEFNQSQDASRMLTSSLPADSGGRNANGDRPLPLVSIILLVYNKLGFSKRCIESILATVNYSNYEIVVTDNASTDGTYEYMSELANRLEKVRYVRNDSNLGFVGGCNTGVANARGEYVILLNNDTIVNKGWLESLVEFAMKTPDCGAVGSKLIYPDGRLQEAGGIIFSDGNGWNYGRGMSPYDPKYNFVREVDYISGASLMVRKDLWDEIGGLDDRFSPAYFEDSDLCFEVRKHGYKVYYEPKSSIIHFEGTTNGTDVNTGRKRYQIINRPKFVEKWEKELSEHYPNDPRIVEKASSRGIIGRIFVTDPSLPMFDRAAGSLHLFNILKALRALKYHVTFVAGNWSNKEYYKPLLEELGIETYAGDPDMMAFLGLSAPYKKIDYARLFEEREFDYAIVDFWYHAEYYVPFIRKYSSKTTIIIDTEDVHFVREIREAKVKGNRELEKLAIENKKRELAVYKKADRIWAVTEEDKKALKKENLHVPVDIRPVIHELPLVKNGFDDRSGILFVGNFNHRPNIDAIEFFSKEVFPIVAKSLPGVTLNVVGNNPGEKVRTLASDNILIRGYVRDLSQYYGNCRVCVAPLRYGAGLKGKVVEALSYGVPMVTTSIGIEGMGLHDRSEVMVADDPNEMADKIVQVYSNKEVWEQISARGRAAMEKTWSFDAGKKSLEELLLLPEKHEMENEQKLTSIVILTYNQLDYTKITIDSLRRHTKSPYEIIVVDNASSDGTVEYLKAQKDIRAIFNEENLGFPAGCNQGIEIAKGDYIVLLNNDVVVTNDWLEGLIECSEADTRVGIVGPMTNWISGFQLEKNISYKKVSQMPAFAGKYRRKNRKRWIEVPRIAGFCMLIKREVVEKIGGLDTIFGIGNCEDDDFCLRSKLAGFKVALAGDVFIHHFGSKSFSQRGIDTYLDVVSSKEKIFQEKWGITPSEWWRDGKSITKTSKLFIPVTGVEPVPVPVQP